MRRASSLAALFALTLGTIVVSASAAAAATLVVDDNLACPGATLTTIQAAVIAATAGDTIQVCAGVYPEVVIVNKSLTLLGAQAGNDARTRTIAAATESIVGTAGGAFVFSANNITLDGFELTGQTAAFWGTALFSQNSTSGHTIVNNYVHDNVIGMYINTNGTNLTLVEHNLLKENNNAGSTSGTAFYSDQGLQNAIVTENTFLDNDNGAFIVSPFTGTTKDVTVSSNLSTGNGNFAVMVGPLSNFDVTDNTATGAAGGGSQVYVSGTTDVVVDGNDISNAATFGVRVDSGANTGLQITGNTLTGNPVGIRVESGALGDSANVHLNSISGNTAGIENLGSTVLNAKSNWWGAADGPSDWNTGTGDTVSAEVDFFQWYTDAAMTTLRACDKTAAAGVWLRLRMSSDGQVVCGSSGNDLIRGWWGDDLIMGNGGHDHIYGGRGDDALIGGAGNDILAGNHDIDSLQGRGGTDSCKVGAEGGQTSSCEGAQLP